MERTCLSSRAIHRALLSAVIVSSPSGAAVLTYSNAAVGVHNWNEGSLWVGTPTNATAYPDIASEDALVSSTLAQINVNANYTIGKLDLSFGALSGSGNLTSAGRFSWTGGTLGGSGLVNANAGFDITAASSALILNGRSIAALASSTWLDGTIRVDANTTIGNNFAGGVFEIGTVGVVASSVGTLTLFNGGTLRYDRAAATTLAKTNIENARLLTIDQGSLSIVGGVNLDDITIASGSSLALNGAFRLHGGSGLSDSVISGLSSASSALTNRSGAVLTVSNNAAGAFTTVLKDVALDNAGTISVPADDVLATTGDAVIHNTGTIEFAGSGGLNNAAVSSTGPGVGLVNDGVLRLTGSAGTVTSYMPITNNAAGTIQVQGGTLDLRGVTTLAGTIDVDAGATLELAYPTTMSMITASTVVDGTLIANAGDVSIDAGATLSGAGRLVAKAPNASRIGSIQVYGAAVGGSLVVDVQNFGNVVFGSAATLGDIDVAGFGEFHAGPGVTAAQVHSLGTLSVLIGGSLVATSIETSGQTLLGGLLRSESSFVNTGQITAGAFGAVEAAAVFDNQGDFAFATGTSSVAALSAPSVSNSGTIYGDGTIDSPSVTSTGALAPGTASDVGIGTIAVVGDLSLGATHFLKVEVDADTGAADKVTATGDVTLAGFLDFVHIMGDASSLAPTQQFTILDGATLTGAFDPTFFVGDRIDAYDDLSHVGSFKVVVDSANAKVYLTDFALVPEPSSMLALGLFGAVLGRRSKR